MHDVSGKHMGTYSVCVGQADEKKKIVLNKKLAKKYNMSIAEIEYSSHCVRVLFYCTYYWIFPYECILSRYGARAFFMHFFFQHWNKWSNLLCKCDDSHPHRLEQKHLLKCNLMPFTVLYIKWFADSPFVIDWRSHRMKNKQANRMNKN